MTWLVFDFLLGILASVGTPLLRAAARLIAPISGTVSSWLLDSAFQSLVAVLLTLGVFYGIGLFASLVLGRKLIETVEKQLSRLPRVQTIYNGMSLPAESPRGFSWRWRRSTITWAYRTWPPSIVGGLAVRSGQSTRP